MLANRNVPNGAKPILSVIGTLPAGTPAACHAAAPGAAGPVAHAAAQPDPRDPGRPWSRPAAGCWSGPGRQWLGSLELPAVSREIIDDCLALTDAVAGPTGRLDEEVRQHAKADPRVRVLTQLPGVGQYTVLVLLAEIGDITRFGSARKLASWAGAHPDRARQ